MNISNVQGIGASKSIENTQEKTANEIDCVVVLIPSLHPDLALVAYVNELVGSGFMQVVIVNDGSGADFEPIFDLAGQIPGCTVLGYDNNKGKGYALKHGFEWITENFTNAYGIVTADSDGQHSVQDCKRVAQALVKHPGNLILGSRDFSLVDVPLKSRTGNRLTSVFFRLLYGYWLPDTQTGLRGIACSLVPQMLQVPGNRFEYEMNMLIYSANWGIPFMRVPISTIYLNDNASTHFRPFRDSARIYGILFGGFFKFVSTGAASTLLDHALFNLFSRWMIPLLMNRLPALRGYSIILLSTIIARVCSSLFNYRVNRQYVFQGKTGKGSLLRYVLLACAVMLTSAFFVEALHGLSGVDSGLAKIVVDTVLFFLNYQAMRRWVFKLKAWDAFF